VVAFLNLSATIAP